MAGWDSLSEGQKAAVFHTDGPAAVYAGPGSGKTRVVTLRTARMAQAGARLLVTTFTSDATLEMRHRIEAMLGKEPMQRVRVTTLHSYCLQLLKIYGKHFALLVDDFQRKNLAESAQAGELEGGVLDFLSAVSYQKNLGITADKYKHDGSSEDMDFVRCWRTFEKEKARKGLLEFDDLILEAAALLETNEEVRKLAASQYTHIIVDECQDMNFPQYRVVFALGRDHKNLMLVGDLDQSLYGFRGADTQTFKRFAAQPKVAVFELQENYRCSRQILRFADSLIRQDADRRVISFVPTRNEGETVTWGRYPDPDIEACAIGDAILRMQKAGVKWKDIAVLYRTNAQAEAVERNFAALEIPFTIREDGDFYSRKEVQGILAYLNFFAPPTPEAAKHQPAIDPRMAEYATNFLLYTDEWLLALLNVPNRKIPKHVGSQLKHHAEVKGKRIWDILPEFHADDMKTHRALRDVMNDLHSIDKKLPFAQHAGDAIKIIRNVTDFDGWLRRESGDDRDNDRIQNIQRMQSAASHYKTIRDYLDAVKKVRDEAARRKQERQKKRREADEVCLSTGHSAKGLEWKCVFAIGWSEQILPHHRAEDIAEERRIAYVIATRARDVLRISSLETWNDAITSPSRFLTGMQLAPPPADAAAGADAAAQDSSTQDEFGGLFMPGA